MESEEEMGPLEKITYDLSSETSDFYEEKLNEMVDKLNDTKSSPGEFMHALLAGIYTIHARLMYDLRNRTNLDDQDYKVKELLFKMICDRNYFSMEMIKVIIGIKDKDNENMH